MDNDRIFLELKAVEDDGAFEGVASVYGVEDLGGDIIEKGAFTKTIAENPVIPVLWQHKADVVIGQGEVSEWQGKVRIKGKIDLEDGDGVKAHGKMKRGLVRGLSIGFQTLKHAWEEIEGNRTIRRIKELKLYEVSVVTFPMLPAAQVTRVKSEEDALKQRLEAVEARISALSAAAKAEGTPQGAAVGEGAASQTTEPTVDHSWVASTTEAFMDIARALAPKK